MKTVKKLVSAMLVGAMTLAMSATAFAAAAGVSSEEEKILARATEKAQELGVDTSASAQFNQYYAQAEKFLAENELTTDQVNELTKAVDDAAVTVKAEMDAQGVTKLGDLKSNTDLVKSLESKVVAQVKAAAEKVGITISVDAEGNYTAKAADTTTPVLDSSNPIKQTGFDLTATVVVVTAFVGAVAVCLVVASKKRFFEEA